MNILLTGHQGYVGSGLHAFWRDRHRVLGWGRKEDIFSLTPAVLAREKIDLLVNCAALWEHLTTTYSADSSMDRLNVEGARHLARALKGSRIGWIQISSKDVYGPVFGPKNIVRRARGDRPRRLFGDDQPFAPSLAYGKSKLIAEYLSESHPRTNVIRLSTCYTDYDHPRGNWMVRMVRDAFAGKAVSLANGGRQFRDPLHVDDLGRLIETIVERGVAGEKINAGGGKDNLISVLEYLRLAAPRAKLRKAPGGDHGFAFLNDKAARIAGWKPRIRVHDRIALIVDNVRSRTFSPTLAVQSP